MNFSLEVGPQTDLDTLPLVKDVYITMLPGGDYKETAKQENEAKLSQLETQNTSSAVLFIYNFQLREFRFVLYR